MGLSNRNGDVKYLSLLRRVCRVPGFFAVNIGCRMMELRGRSLQMYSAHSAKPAVRPHLAEWLCPRPGRDVSARSETERDPQSYHAAAPAVRSKNSPVLSIACIVTASFRATATAARLKPILSRSLRPHVRRLLPAQLRVRMTVAAS